MTAEDVDFIRKHGGSNVKLETFSDQGHNLHRTAFDRFIVATKGFLAG